MSKERIAGKIIKVHSANQDTGFCIVTVKATGSSKSIIEREKPGKDTITVLGIYFSPEKGDEIICDGFFKNNPRYGKQFSSRVMVRSELLAERFMDEVAESDLFIKLPLAERMSLFKQFESDLSGASARYLLGRNSSETLAVSQMISQIEGYNYLRNIGLNKKVSHNIAEYFRNKVLLEVATRDPFEIMSVPDCGYATVTRLLDALKVPMDSKARNFGFVDNIINDFVNMGHTSIPIPIIFKEVQKKTLLPEADCRELTFSRMVDGDFSYTKSIISSPSVGSKRFVSMERRIAQNLRRLMSFDTGKDIASSISIDESFFKKGANRGGKANGKF